MRAETVVGLGAIGSAGFVRPRDLAECSHNAVRVWLGAARWAWRTAPTQHQHDSDDDQQDDDQTTAGARCKESKHQVTIAPRRADASLASREPVHSVARVARCFTRVVVSSEA